MLCECGCGGLAPIAKVTDRSCGTVKGQPNLFISGHNLRIMAPRGVAHPNWRGGRARHSAGYTEIYQPTHPRAMQRGYVFEHLLVAELALGRALPLKAEVHHVNHQPADNRPSNLVICENHAYHHLLHRRARAYAASGSARGIKCMYCQQWGMPGESDFSTVQRTDGMRGISYHRACVRLDRLQRR